MTADQIYAEAKANGCNDRLADMLASRQAPGAMTDREFFEGRGTLADQFAGAEGQLAKVVAAARAQGYEPKPNDVYVPTLANSIGDPLAFVPPTGGRNHVRRVCEQRQTSCEGAVTVQAPMYREPTPDKPLSDKLIREKSAILRKKHPKATARDLRGTKP